MIDLSFLEKFTKGDSKKIKRYITLYLDVAPKTFEEMQRNLNNKNWEQLRINAHSLKPQADFMGISSLKQVLINIEDNIKNDDYGSLDKLYKEAFAIHLESERVLKAKL